jgi:hypothetical protein
MLAVLLAVLGLLGLAGVQVNLPVPWWVVLFVIMVTIGIAVFRAGHEQYRQRLTLAGRLKPKLEIVGVGPPSHDHHRIMVHNKTSKTLKFRARLFETKPSLKDYALPVALQPTHCKDLETLGEIGPDGKQPVDVLIDYGHPNIIAIKLMGNPPCNLEFPRDQRMELLIDVYPVSDEGESDRRWFYAVPQIGGNVVFTADGSVKQFIKPASPSAG